MKLKIITPSKGLEIEKEAYIVEAEGVEGKFGILDKHMGFITPLKKQSTLQYKIKATNPVNEVKLSDGILEVTQNDNQTEVRVIASNVSI